MNFIELKDFFFLILGNAMGFVRMMRSGAIHCGSSSDLFLPKISQNNFHFIDTSKWKCIPSITTINAANNLEYEIKNLSSNSIEKTDYFHVSQA